MNKDLNKLPSVVLHNNDIYGYNIQICSGTGLGLDIITNLKKAKKSIKIISPYFGDNGKDVRHKIVQTLKELDNNISIEILTTADFLSIKTELENEEDDEKRKELNNVFSFLKETQNIIKWYVINNDVEHYNYKNINNLPNSKYNFPHSKVIIIDDNILYLGSVNLTTSAFNYNSETRIKFEKNVKVNNNDLFKKYNNFFYEMIKYYSEYFYSDTEIQEFINNIETLMNQKFEDSDKGIEKKNRKKDFQNLKSLELKNQNLESEIQDLNSDIEDLNKLYHKKEKELKQQIKKRNVCIAILIIIIIYILIKEL